MIIEFEKLYCTKIAKKADKVLFPFKVYLELEEIPEFIEEYKGMLKIGIQLNIDKELEYIIADPTVLEVSSIREQLK